MNPARRRVPFTPDEQDKLFEDESDPGNKLRGHLPVLAQSRKNVARGQKVAVIGAEPAGIACAHDLAPFLRGPN